MSISGPSFRHYPPALSTLLSEPRDTRTNTLTPVDSSILHPSSCRTKHTQALSLSHSLWVSCKMYQREIFDNETVIALSSITALTLAGPWGFHRPQPSASLYRLLPCFSCYLCINWSCQKHRLVCPHPHPPTSVNPQTPRIQIQQPHWLSRQTRRHDVNIFRSFVCLFKRQFSKIV